MTSMGKVAHEITFCVFVFCLKRGQLLGVGNRAHEKTFCGFVVLPKTWATFSRGQPCPRKNVLWFCFVA